MIDPLRLASVALEFGAAHYANGGRTTAPLVFIIVGIVFAGAGGGFAVAALLIYLIPVFGAAGAALAVSGTLIACATIALVAGDQLSRRRHAQQVRTADLRSDLHSLAAGAEGFIRENKTLALSAAFVAGLLAGDEGSRRR